MSCASAKKEACTHQTQVPPWSWSEEGKGAPSSQWPGNIQDIKRFQSQMKPIKNGKHMALASIYNIVPSNSDTCKTLKMVLKLVPVCVLLPTPASGWCRPRPTPVRTDRRTSILTWPLSPAAGEVSGTSEGGVRNWLLSFLEIHILMRLTKKGASCHLWGCHKQCHKPTIAHYKWEHFIIIKTIEFPPWTATLSWWRGLSIEWS